MLGYLHGGMGYGGTTDRRIDMTIATTEKNTHDGTVHYLDACRCLQQVAERLMERCGATVTGLTVDYENDPDRMIDITGTVTYTTDCFVDPPALGKGIDIGGITPLIMSYEINRPVGAGIGVGIPDGTVYNTLSMTFVKATGEQT